mgnify:CR=1 FL=1
MTHNFPNIDQTYIRDCVYRIVMDRDDNKCSLLSPIKDRVTYIQGWKNYIYLISIDGEYRLIVKKINRKINESRNIL